MKTNPFKSIWEKEWKKYNRHPYFKPNKKVVEIISHCFSDKLLGKKIIELGAGSGSDIVCLAQKGACAHALDFSNESICTMKYWAKKKKVNVKIIKADIKKIPFADNYFDLAYSVGLMEHFANPLPPLREQIRVVKPGGFLLIDVPQKYTLYTIAKHIRLKLKTHPFGWETEYSKQDLIHLAKKLNLEVHLIYGRDSDLILRTPECIKDFLQKIFSKTLENSFLASYICLCLGAVYKVNKSKTSRN